MAAAVSFDPRVLGALLPLLTPQEWALRGHFGLGAGAPMPKPAPSVTGADPGREELVDAIRAAWDVAWPASNSGGPERDPGDDRRCAPCSCRSSERTAQGGRSPDLWLRLVRLHEQHDIRGRCVEDVSGEIPRNLLKTVRVPKVSRPRSLCRAQCWRRSSSREARPSRSFVTVSSGQACLPTRETHLSSRQARPLAHS
jgi:hypothetical protein